MQRSPWASSPTMSIVARLSWCLAACLTVSGCTQIVDFDRSKIEDDRKDGAMPRDSGMDGGGSKDSGAKDSGPMKDTGVDSGPTDACDPMTHDGCMPSELCCVVDAVGTLGCVATSLTQCEACGTACDVAVANDCTERTCGCGWMSKVECSGATPKCDGAQGECVECVNSNDCAGNPDGEYCFIPTSTADAKDNTCVACDRATNAGCSGTTPICNDAAVCEPCSASPNNCGGTLVCLTAGPSAGACQCATSADCTTPTTPICNTTSKICDPCTSSGQCNSKTPGEVCEIATGDCVDCLQNTDCAANEYCLNKVCTPDKAAGASCGAAAECASNFCVDGVCCNNACNSTCNACSAAKKGTGADGTCGPISAAGANPDPDNECTGALSCNGAGACEKNDGEGCTLGVECESGFCVDGVCCEDACAGTCRACSAAKKGSGSNGVCDDVASNADPDNECAGTLSCNGSAACEKANGVACTGAATGPECESGFCTDGVCCNEACGGTCRACTAARKGSGSDGTCGNIAASTDPAPEECPGQPVCNGSGACVECVVNGDCTTVVGRPFCDAGSCVACLDSDDCTTATTPICNASNVCVACTSSGQCSPKAGGDDVCETATGACVDCLLNTDCAANQYCLNKVCTADKANGTDCGDAAECTSNFCVDGVCCNDGCTGTCDACSTAAGAAANGTCGPAALNTTDAACGALGCNGDGACQKANGVACSGGATGPECDSGFCVDGVCCENACAGTCNACSTTAGGTLANGVCSIVANGTADPSCPNGCDGAGVCVP